MNPAFISAVMAPNLKIKEIATGTRRSTPIPNQNIGRCSGGQRANPYNVAQHINGNSHLVNMRRILRIPQISTHMPPMELMGMESVKCVIKNGKWGQWLKGSLHKRSTRKNCTELGMAVLKYLQGRTYRRLYGRVRCGPLRWMRDPTLILTLTLYSGPHAAARLDPPLKPQGIGFKTQRYG